MDVGEGGEEEEEEEDDSAAQDAKEMLDTLKTDGEENDGVCVCVSVCVV